MQCLLCLILVIVIKEEHHQRLYVYVFCVLLNQSHFQYLDDLNLLRKETMCFRKEGRRGGIGLLCRQRQRNSNSEKNQIRSCDHVWFPSLSECFVSEHAVLSTRLVSLCYATDLAKRI